jgi:hypothetical protein
MKVASTTKKLTRETESREIASKCSKIHTRSSLGIGNIAVSCKEDRRGSKLEDKARHSLDQRTKMSFPPGMIQPPPGASSSTAGSSSMPREVLAQKSQKWTQLQNRRYAEKRKQGFIDVGKQVCWHQRDFISYNVS